MISAAVGASSTNHGPCCRWTRCWTLPCLALWSIIYGFLKYVCLALWLVEGILRTFVVEPIFVKPVMDLVERKRNEYVLTDDEIVSVDNYFIATAVGQSVTIRQYLFIFLPSSFCPCCFYQSVHVPQNLCWSKWISSGTAENVLLKSILCMILCALLAAVLRIWFPLSFSLLSSIVLCGLMIGWPIFRIYGLLFALNLVHEDGRKISLGILYLYLFTVPTASIVHNTESLSSVVGCVAQRAFRCFREDVQQAVRPFVEHVIYVADSIKQLNHNLGVDSSVRRVFKAVLDAFSAARPFCNCDNNPELSPVDTMSCSLREMLAICRKIPTKSAMIPFEIDSVADKVDFVFEQFHAEVTVIWKVNDSKPRDVVAEVYRRARNIIYRRIALLVHMLRFVSKLYYSATIWLLYKITRYIYCYQTDVTFENHYITPQLEFRDRERKRLGLESALPLQTEEVMKFVDFTSLGLTWDEIVRTCSNSVSVSFVALSFVALHLVDVALYEAANAMVTAVSPEATTITTTTSGEPEGFWRRLMQSLHHERFNHLAPLSECYVTPQRPRKDHLDSSVLYISLAVVLAITSSYITRLRPLVVSLYLRYATTLRSQWLHQLLLDRRKIGPFLAQLAQATRHKLWNLPIVWELTERADCIRCFSAENAYVLLYRCSECDHYNCGYCIDLNRDCGSCGALMPHSPLGLEDLLIDMKTDAEKFDEKSLI